MNTCLFVYMFFLVFFFCVFSMADRIDRVVLDYRQRAHSKGNEKF